MTQATAVASFGDAVQITDTPEGERMVDARSLHELLGPKATFNMWIARRITKAREIGLQDDIGQILTEGTRNLAAKVTAARLMLGREAMLMTDAGQPLSSPSWIVCPATSPSLPASKTAGPASSPPTCPKRTN